MDTGRISEMSGIHRLGGEIVVGVNNSWDNILRSSLLRPGASALVEAAALMEEEQPGGVLLHALDTAPGETLIHLALTVLDAKIELAMRESSARILRQTIPWQHALKSPPEQPYLPINICFHLPIIAVGSALHQETHLSPLQPDVSAAAVLMILDPDSGQITAARLALGNPPFLCPALAGIIGLKPGREAIAEAVRLVRSCRQKTGDDYSFALSPHLLRETLDLALARAQAH
jgi:CO/xanthine dehydrogenase FAD-binding subunit